MSNNPSQSNDKRLRKPIFLGAVVPMVCRARPGSFQVSSFRYSVWAMSLILLLTGLGMLAMAGCYFNKRDCASSVDVLPVHFWIDSLSCIFGRRHHDCQSFAHSRYSAIRASLDYTYHEAYSPSRIQLQDTIIDSVLHELPAPCQNRSGWDTSPTNTTNNEQWIVFTAGAMGSGKSHTLRVLHAQSLFPLHAFVTVDPDRFRPRLPEFQHYIQHHPEQAGEWTRKEAGLMAEILVEAALHDGRNVLVDGSLRDATWYARYFAKLRRQYPRQLRFAILHVVAPRQVVLARAKSRASITGRVVPQHLLESSLEQVPRSVARLSSSVDFVAELFNGNDNGPIELVGMEWETFRQQWKGVCGGGGDASPPLLDTE